MGNKVKLGSFAVSNVRLPDEPKTLYGCFEQMINGTI